ncbi:MAG: isoprenyl transferase [Bacteroidales bacterium]|nr:isoprenyl transferase [Bacteroidales bacterium]
MTLKEQIDIERLPKHIAIIMDGNGRWAKERGKPRLFGHRNAIQAVRDVNEACAELGVPYLTLFAFSTENWNRPVDEVGGLMGLLGQTLKNEEVTFLKNNIRLTVTGDLAKMPTALYNQLQGVVNSTRHGTRMTLNLALSYSGRWEITEAARRIAKEVKEGRLDPDAITQETFGSFLATAGMPDPELLIRTSGELRISNFLLWELAYSELYFTDKYWPDFRRDDLYEAILDFQHRERRFGKTSEQINKK